MLQKVTGHVFMSREFSQGFLSRAQTALTIVKMLKNWITLKLRMPVCGKTQYWEWENIWNKTDQRVCVQNTQRISISKWENTGAVSSPTGMHRDHQLLQRCSAHGPCETHTLFRRAPKKRTASIKYCWGWEQLELSRVLAGVECGSTL